MAASLFERTIHQELLLARLHVDIFKGSSSDNPAVRIVRLGLNRIGAGRYRDPRYLDRFRQEKAVPGIRMLKLVRERIGPDIEEQVGKRARRLHFGFCRLGRDGAQNGPDDRASHSSRFRVIEIFGSEKLTWKVVPISFFCPSAAFSYSLSGRNGAGIENASIVPRSS